MAIELKTKDTAGQDVGGVSLDEEAFGGKVKTRLIHAASVMYHANLRQGSHCTKSRGEIAGSTKKLYRQKGTGRARAGNKKSGTRKGGGVIHGPKPRDYSYHMPQKQRRAALKSTILGKAKDGELHLVKGLDLEAPKTKGLIEMLGKLGLAGDTVLLATAGVKQNVYLAGRNNPLVQVIPGDELNVRAILRHKHLVLDEAVFEALNHKDARVSYSRKPRGSRKGGQIAGAEQAIAEAAEETPAPAEAAEDGPESAPAPAGGEE